MLADMDDQITVDMTLEDGYAFGVELNDAARTSLLLDEPEPLGEGRGPNAARLLAAAVGNCLSASALLCLRKSRIEVQSMHTTVQATMVRNERGRLRIGGIQVHIEPVVAPADLGRMQRCMELFEDFCVVTQSVRDGIGVDVEVTPQPGEVAPAVA